METDDAPSIMTAGREGSGCVDLDAGGSEQVNGGGDSVTVDEPLNPSEKDGSDGRNNEVRRNLSSSGSGAGALHRNGRKSLAHSVSLLPGKGLRKGLEGKAKSMYGSLMNGSAGGASNRASVSAQLTKSPTVTVTNTRRSLPVKPCFVVANGAENPSDVIQSHDGVVQQSGHMPLAKPDDDTQSNSSNTTVPRKSSNSGFAFRLNERAEKRKEFFIKLEEKSQAKEAEKSNLQAKSKENQEAEIKQLRKSLTFKATPMPSFYQEPGPPKVELKKIPPTRAISPKLGRHKPSAAMADSSSQGGVPCRSLHACLVQSKPNDTAAMAREGSATAKKVLQKSVTKLPPYRPSLPATKHPGSKPSIPQSKQKMGKTRTDGLHEAQEESHPDDVNVESENKIELPGAVLACKEVPVLG